ncbi:uncharacterized protein LOC141576785 [Camelus bactrianus]|uniref:Uncharacterized protein LOC141576785 n=1 Tax=Camelus bactrianus TaxID=9837 RepID=A0AC58Q1Y4_CAMBA
MRDLGCDNLDSDPGSTSVGRVTMATPVNTYVSALAPSPIICGEWVHRRDPVTGSRSIPLTPRREERSGSSSRGGSLSPRGGSGSHWRRPLPLAVNPAARPRPTGGAWQDAAPRGLSGRLQDGRALGVRTCWRPRAPFTATAADQSRRSARRLRGLTTRGGRPPWRPWKSWRRPSSPSSPSRGRLLRLNPLSRHRSHNRRRRRPPSALSRHCGLNRYRRRLSHLSRYHRRRRRLSPLSWHHSLNRHRHPPSALSRYRRRLSPLSRHRSLNRHRRPPSRGSGAAAQTEG